MLFLLLLLAHLLGDFIFQSNNMATQKFGVNRYMLAHVGIHVFLSSIALAMYFAFGTWSFGVWLEAIVVIASTHVFLDGWKVWLDSRLGSQAPLQSANRRARTYTFTFLADQALHLIVLVVIVTVFPLHLATSSMVLQVVMSLVHGTKLSLSPFGHVVSFGIVLILSTRFSGILVGKLATPAPKQGRILVETKITSQVTGSQLLPEDKVEKLYAENIEPEPPRGMLIGYLERFIVMGLVYGQSVAAIGLIVAAKSLVRFKQLDHREWAEYFLVGTLSSILLGMLWGHLLRVLM